MLAVRTPDFLVTSPSSIEFRTFLDYFGPEAKFRGYQQLTMDLVFYNSELVC